MRRVLLPLDLVPPPPSAGEVARLTGPTMGVDWRVSAVLAPALLPAALAAAVQARLDGLVMQMSPWERASDISRFNASAAGEWLTLPDDFAAVVARALHWAQASRGAFDPTLGRLIDLWGFGPAGPVVEPPAPTAITEALAAAGWSRLTQVSGAPRLRQPGGLSLDLSGIAKGYAVDAVADLLRAAGVENFLVEIGGECRGEGVKPGGEPWWVALAPPAGAADPQPIVCGLHGLAVATSGGHLHDIIRQGRVHSHTIDGRTGEPALGDVTSVSVVAKTAMDADAAATVLMVLESGAALAFAETHGLAARLWVDGEERLSSAFAKMLE